MDTEKIKKNKIESQMRKAQAIRSRAQAAVRDAENHSSAATRWGKANIAKKRKAAGNADANYALAERNQLDYESGVVTPRPRRPRI